MKTGYVLKNSQGDYYIHRDIYGPLEEAKVFFEFQEARSKAQEFYLNIERVEVKYRILEGS